MVGLDLTCQHATTKQKTLTFVVLSLNLGFGIRWCLGIESREAEITPKWEPVSLPTKVGTVHDGLGRRPEPRVTPRRRWLTSKQLVAYKAANMQLYVRHTAHTGQYQLLYLSEYSPVSWQTTGQHLQHMHTNIHTYVRSYCTHGQAWKPESELRAAARWMTWG